MRGRCGINIQILLLFSPPLRRFTLWLCKPQEWEAQVRNEARVTSLCLPLVAVTLLGAAVTVALYLPAALLLCVYSSPFAICILLSTCNFTSTCNCTTPLTITFVRLIGTPTPHFGNYPICPPSRVDFGV